MALPWSSAIIGPLLFLIYINDLPNCLNEGLPRMYADDTNINMQSNNLSELENLMNAEIANLNTWLEANNEEDDAVTNPIQLAINKGANITEPDRAAISRKRKIVKNSGKYKASRVKNHSKNDTCVWDKLKDFPGQHFVNENGQLRCNACSEIISIKKSSIEKHVQSKKHVNGIASIAKSKKENQTILECLKKQDIRDRASGSTLPEDMRLFRFELVETFLLAVQVQQLKPDAAALEEFSNFPFVNDNTIANLANELPDYLAAVDGVTLGNEDEKVTWWAVQRDTLPHWSALVKKKLLLIQPSSAAAERVFSLLNSMSSQQGNSLEDYIEASVMVRYNSTQRKH
ncbi:RNA-directed DNA polymerase from transposon BS [Paramuricea clavata]|uniref:RNA-directed DNA polymerase from transposon BS n=1 Tax=Paramuricea clavata TaxID=317549 RepID=A0A6S7GS66_PARCT|nr:RNA-directed DNA polymerase from transposon BS [Paramuricea clavata]